MAERRMFAKNVIDSDLFLDMPLSTQALYFHLAMRADDDGFVNNPKKIARMIGANDDSLKLLCAKQFIIPFESGIVVIRHWKIHNYIRKDTYKATTYKSEKCLLSVDESDRYILRDESVTNPSQHRDSIVDGSLTQDRIGKDRIGKDRIGIISADDAADSKPKRHKHGEFKHVLLTDDEYSRLISDYGEDVTHKYIKKVDEYCEQSGKTYKNYNLAIRNTFMSRDNVKPKEQKRDIFSLPDEQLTEQERIIKKLRC